MLLFQDLLTLYCVVISNDDVINGGDFGSMEPWVHSIPWGEYVAEWGIDVGLFLSQVSLSMGVHHVRS